MTTHTRRGPPKVTIWTGEDTLSTLEVGPEVRSFQCQKALGAPSGTWRLVLAPGQVEAAWGLGHVKRRTLRYRDIRPNMPVAIGFEEAGGIMFGLVDSVTERVQAGGPSASQVIEVSGRDMGKVLEVDNVIRATTTTIDAVDFKTKLEAALGADHPTAIDIEGVWGPDNEAGVPTFLAQSVQDVIDWVLDHAPSMRIPVLQAALGGTGKPGDFINTDFSITTWNDGRLWSEAPCSYQGNLWAFLQSVLDVDFYEVRIDTFPNQGLTEAGLPAVALIVRPKPFDEAQLDFAPLSDTPGIDWENLTTFVEGLEHHEIALDEVVTFSLGVSSNQALSYYLVTAQHELIGNIDGLKEGLIYPLVDTYTARAFGLKSYEARLAIVAGDLTEKAAGATDYDGQVRDDVHNYRNRLFNWYRLNPWMETGTITVVGRDRFRPGDPVYLPWRQGQYGEPGLRYYCTGVSWSWELGGHYLSTLTLERGHNDSMISEVKDIIEIDGSLLTPPNPDHYADA